MIGAERPALGHDARAWYSQICDSLLIDGILEQSGFGIVELIPIEWGMVLIDRFGRGLFPEIEVDDRSDERAGRKLKEEEIYFSSWTVCGSTASLGFKKRDQLCFDLVD